MAYKTLACLMLLALLAGSALAQAPGAAPTAPPTKSPSPAPAAPTTPPPAPTPAPSVPAPTPAPSVPAPTPATSPTTSPSSSPATSPPSPLAPGGGGPIAIPPSDSERGWLEQSHDGWCFDWSGWCVVFVDVGDLVMDRMLIIIIIFINVSF
ncbi:classical arabinogalactan protein 3-like [Populus alba x Populus x berolinensis]|nr:classical arabinogalactan protein 3-like [Populus alba x Populus x berolinensis]